MPQWIVNEFKWESFASHCEVLQLLYIVLKL